MDFRESWALESGRNLEGLWCAELSKFLGREGNSVVCCHPLVQSPVSPSGAPAIQYLTYSQNVAGLWLKYGAKPLNKGGFVAAKESAIDVKFC
jgi:hypothetical protein